MNSGPESEQQRPPEATPGAATATDIATLTREIDRRKTAERQLIKANRLISLGSAINKLIIHSKTEAEILEEICRIAVRDGGFIMSWFGLVNKHDNAIDPKFSNGHVDGYFECTPRIRLQHDAPEGKGPAGQAYRDKKMVINNDIADTTDASYALWREHASRRGYRSSIGMPIFKKDELYGIFSLYHTQPFFFNTSEEKLLMEIADNLTFAINKIQDAEERRSLERKLQATYDSLAEAHKQLDLFTYRASHDLRGPIASLLGLCAIGRLDLDDSPLALDLLGKVESTATNLDDVLKHFTAALEINRREVKFSHVSFPQLFANLSTRFKDDPLHITTAIGEVTLYSDQELLQIALEKMLDNSLCHKKPAHDRCTVHITVQYNTLNDTSITVTDDGTGIPMEFKQRIFEMFFKGSTLSKGSGIGLYVVKNILTKLGGSVLLRTSDHTCTQFEMVLPANKPQEV